MEEDRRKKPTDPSERLSAQDLVDENAIFSNAVDSLRMGVQHFLDASLTTRDKWAAIALFHCIELLLKERLRREHPLLIYRSVDKPLGPNSITVGVTEALARFENLGVRLEQSDRLIIESLQRERNRIEHHQFAPAEDLRTVLGKALKVIHVLLDDHLEESLEGHVEADAFRAIKELIFEYDELVKQAVARAESRRPMDPKEAYFFELHTCPECGEDTVVKDEDGATYCEMCECRIEAGRCDECGSLMPIDDELPICQNCFDYKMSRD